MIEAWGNIYPQNGFQLPHFHIGSVLSGVYFVQSPKKRGKDSSGHLELYDPRIVNNLPMEKLSYKIDPDPGVLVIFPSWLKHAVSPNKSMEERVSVAFNFGILEQKPWR